jgi:pimeloyl-ACP methyl ester carboxylesterase
VSKLTDCVVLLHGWPGTSRDFRLVRETLQDRLPVHAPDLAGFGAAFAGPVEPAEATADAHAARVLAALDAAGHERVVLGGYDIGSRVAQAIARLAPERVTGMVVTPYFAALARYTTDPAAQRHYWYQHLHRLPLADELIDGDRAAVAAYLTHFWSTWSGNPALAEDLDETIDAYARPGAFTASIAWYRANLGYSADTEVLRQPAIVLWGDADPLFPAAWSDATADSFADAQVRILEGVGHFVPLEAPAAFAAALTELS